MSASVWLSGWRAARDWIPGRPGHAARYDFSWVTAPPV